MSFGLGVGGDILPSGYKKKSGIKEQSDLSRKQEGNTVEECTV